MELSASRPCKVAQKVPPSFAANIQISFPGHYSGRAVHTHMLAHMNATVQSNGTISIWEAPVSHIGQLFWPEDLRAEVEALEPYTQNTVELTTNDEDMWSILQADSNYDPIPQFIYLGDDIADGLFAWIQIGINASADYTEVSLHLHSLSMLTCMAP